MQTFLTIPGKAGGANSTLIYKEITPLCYFHLSENSTCGPKAAAASGCFYLCLSSTMASRLAVLKAVPGLLASWESCRFTHFGEPADREQLKPALRTSSLLQPQKIWTKGQTTVSCSIFWVFSLGVLLTSLSKRIALGKVCRRHSSCCHLTMSYEAYARPQSPQSTAKSKG